MTELLPLFFIAAMGLSLLIYVIMDGFDLGIGMLLPLAKDEDKDLMIAAIGPYWDANETWIVLGISILLVAFPTAYGIILTSLYLPVVAMLLGLILRGVAFDFRAKVVAKNKATWNRNFFLGSLLTSVAQGWMLGAYITGLGDTAISYLFSALIAVTLPALYVLLGAAWLLIKTEDRLFNCALRWARNAIVPMGVALLLVSIATPMVSSTIARKWFSFPESLPLLPIPILSTVLYGALWWLLYRKDSLLCKGREWLLFVGLALICLLAAFGLAYSILPDIIIGKLAIRDTVASTDSLRFTFWGVAVVLPTILIYTVVVHRIFRGKAKLLD